MELNPVLPGELDGLEITVTFWNQTKNIRYRVKNRGYGAAELLAEGKPLSVSKLKDLYREGGIRISREQWLELPRELTLQTY